MNAIKIFTDVRTFFYAIPEQEKRITLATLCTIMRIILTPFIVSAIIKGHWGCAGCLFLGAAITDFLDGFFARYFIMSTVCLCVIMSFLSYVLVALKIIKKSKKL